MKVGPPQRISAGAPARFESKPELENVEWLDRLPRSGVVFK
jgi:hypothetical protein